MQNVTDAAHLVHFNVNLPIFLSPFNFPKVASLRQHLKRIPTDANDNSTANDHPLGMTLATGSSNDICGTPKGESEAGQINGAFNSIEVGANSCLFFCMWPTQMLFSAKYSE